MKALRLVLALFVAAVFLVSGGLKLADPARFLVDVRSFALLPPLGAYLTALFIPVLEVVAALALATPWRRGAALLLGALSLGFIGLLSLAEARGLAVDCGCFGDWLVFPTLWMHLAFNAVLALACAVLVLSRPGGRTRHRTA